MNINEIIAKELDVKVSQVEKTVELIDQGNTIPFIARYKRSNRQFIRRTIKRFRFKTNIFKKLRGT